VKRKAVLRTPLRRPDSYYLTDPVAFIDDLIKINERGQPFHLLPHQRTILRTAFTFDAEGRLPWDTFLYSAPKKSGKTTVNAALQAWWAYTQEPPNELFNLANDLDQSRARAFSTLSRLIERNPALAASARALDRDRIALTNGTDIRALPSDFAGAAGSDHGLVSFDELWAYTSESSRRLWEELTPVPTRRNSIRIVTTYAGWEGESELLHALYLQGVGPEEHPAGQGERLLADLPLYLNRAARLLVYWDHAPRMPWQTPRYYAAQRAQLRPSAYIRLHENAWTTAESTFLTPELWDACVDGDARPLLPALGRELRCPVWVGIDAATKNDYAACAAVTRTADNQIRLVRHWLFKPGPGAPINLEQTVEQAVWEAAQGWALQVAYCDPFQMHRSLVTLQQQGLPVKEFPQTQTNTTRMGTVLYDLVKGRNLLCYPDAELREQALHCVAIETPRGFRLAKEKATRKIDLIAALAMACCAALDEPAALPPLTEEELAEHAWQEARVMSSLGFPPADPLESHPLYVKPDYVSAPTEADDGLGQFFDNGRP